MAQLVEALRCKPEGRGFDFSLTEMSTRNISGGRGGGSKKVK